MTAKLKLAIKCKEIRQKSGKSVNKWANHLGLKREQILEFERGVTTIPTLVLIEYAKLKENRERKSKNEKINR